MEGKLLKILAEYLYNKSGETNEGKDLDITIYVDMFWFTMISTEAVSEWGHWHVNVENKGNEINFKMMNHKMTFSLSAFTNAETNEFFEAVYSQLP